jgi:hypothetical protein
MELNRFNIEEELISLNIIQKEFVEMFYPRTRDDAQVQVNRCQKSNVIFLSSNEYRNERYEEKKFVDLLGGRVS